MAAAAAAAAIRPPFSPRVAEEERDKEREEVEPSRSFGTKKTEQNVGSFC